MNSALPDDESDGELPQDDGNLLPAEGETTRSLSLGESAALDDLGPVVVTEDGQLRRIDNFAQMTPEEKEATQRIIARRNAARLKRLRGGSSVGATALPSLSYSYGGFEVSYRRKPAATGHEAKPPLLLIHPVGIGLHGWFWDRFLDQWVGAEVFVPDLIGCGGSADWAPERYGDLSAPLDWVRQCEALWRDGLQDRPVVVVAQGGIAPLAVQLASRKTDDWDGARRAPPRRSDARARASRRSKGACAPLARGRFPKRPPRRRWGA